MVHVGAEHREAGKETVTIAQEQEAEGEETAEKDAGESSLTEDKPPPSVCLARKAKRKGKTDEDVVAAVETIIGEGC